MTQDLCTHGIPYVSCAGCRAENVLKGYNLTNWKQISEEMRKVEVVADVERCLTSAVDALKDAWAHLRMGMEETLPLVPGDTAGHVLAGLEIVENARDAVAVIHRQAFTRAIEAKVRKDLEDLANEKDRPSGPTGA